MMTGALQAMQEAGLDTSKYWLGASNGKEKSWDWVATGHDHHGREPVPDAWKPTSPTSMIKADFAGKPHKKAHLRGLPALRQEHPRQEAR